MPALTPDTIRALAAASLPYVRFDRRERFFPVRAEAWLTHASSAPWTSVPGDVAALPVDPHGRGTALCTADPQFVEVKKLAGAPNPYDRPLQVRTGSAADMIGNPLYAAPPKPPSELFLDFAGWADRAAPHLGGDLDYLYRAFSELASAMNHDQPWELLATDANRPRFAQPQPPSPAVYTEVDWAGVHPRVAAAGGWNDFAGATATRLDRYVQVTHYFLFAARTALADQREVRPLEGQWAAVSLFYPAAVNVERLDDGHRPLEIDVRSLGNPSWVVLSGDPGDARPRSTVWRVGAQAQAVDGHVSAWVTAGTHRFLPAADPTEASPASPEAWPALEYEPGSDIEGLGLFVFFGSAAVVAWEEWPWWIGWLGALVMGILALVGLIIALLMALISLITEIWDDDLDESDIPHPAEPPVNGGGEVGNPAAGTPAAAEPDMPGAAEQPGAWGTNGGSPVGHDVAYFDMRVVSRLQAAAAGAPDLAPPAWWDYAGRWGIMVPQRADRAWDAGTRRTDGKGRSWGYWQANDLLNRLVQDAPTPEAP